MPDVLIDTSAWVDFFRQGEGPVAATLDRLLEDDQAVLCGVVEMELLQGVRAKDRSRLRVLLCALRYVSVEREDFLVAGERLGELRRGGITVPATDALIAALCTRHRLELLTTDRHFEHFPAVKRHARLSIR